MSRARGRLTLLTDFGTADGYVAAMKGVIAAITPDAIIDDASHDIEPGDIAAGAWALAGYWRLYPPGTVHVAVVDPGVGTERLPLAAIADGRIIVAPDNGLLTHVLAEAEQAACVEIRLSNLGGMSVSATFHGRDIFAPVAARLAAGADVAGLGPPLARPVLLPGVGRASLPGAAAGSVVHVDRFGNLITDIPARAAPAGSSIVIGGREVARARTYADVAPGELVALAGSRGLVEVAVRDGSAAERLGVGRGAPVVVRTRT